MTATDSDTSPLGNEEQEFLRDYEPEAFQRPSVAVDVAILSAFDGSLHGVLLQRAQLPERGKWALPGGFVRMDESLDDAATRLLREKAGLGELYLEQLYTFGAPGRDPRMRIIAVAYVALVSQARLRTALNGVSGVQLGRISVPWEGETGGPVDLSRPDGQTVELAFDHVEILGMAVKRLRGKLNYTPIGFQLLPEVFTLRALQEVHETILGRPLNKDSFRRRMLASDQLEATGGREDAVGHRPAELYRFVRRSAI